MKFNNSRLNRVFRCLCILLMMGCLAACKQESEKNIAVKRQGPEICEGNLLVHLGEYPLLVARQGVSITLEDRTELNQLTRPQPGYECHVDEIKNAVRVSWSEYHISLIKEGYDYKGFKGKYGDIENEYLKAKEEGRVEIFPDGLEVVNPEKIIYVLPKKEFLTHKGYPVSFVCSSLQQRKSSAYKGGCDTSYAVSPSIYVRYSFSLSKPLSEEILMVEKEAIKIEKERRAFLKNMLDGGAVALKNKNSVQGD